MRRSAMDHSDGTVTSQTAISVVIPVADGEPRVAALARQALAANEVLEAIVVVHSTDMQLRLSSELSEESRVRVVVARKGRAHQLNAGARIARGRYLWFLHADSRLGDGAVAALVENIRRHPEDLHFFRLRFAADGPRWVKLNEWGADVRSRLLKMPFGDQGLCLKRAVFLHTGGFNEEARIGEDNLLVWKLRHRGIAPRPVPAWLETSARKYETKGWWAVTRSHLWITTEQALPNYWQMIKRFWGKGPADGST